MLISSLSKEKNAVADLIEEEDLAETDPKATGQKADQEGMVVLEDLENMDPSKKAVENPME